MPDDNVVRAQAHYIVFIADSFQVVSQLPTRVWLIARFRLHQFYAFELLMEEVKHRRGTQDLCRDQSLAFSSDGSSALSSRRQWHLNAA